MDDSLTESTDLTLLRLCSQGDERGLAQLHVRYASFCRHRAFIVLRDAALAEEAVQDAFLDLWNSAAAYDEARSQVRTWLCVLVHRRSVDVARREARHRLGDAALPAVDPASYTAEEILILQLDRRRVCRALDRLSPLHRQVISLAYWGGLTQAQIALCCEVPVGTIKSRTFDALTRLATLLNRTDIGQPPIAGS